MDSPRDVLGMRYTPPTEASPQRDKKSSNVSVSYCSGPYLGGLKHRTAGCFRVRFLALHHRASELTSNRLAGSGAVRPQQRGRAGPQTGPKWQRPGETLSVKLWPLN